jgi:hypothetical protein
MAAPEKAEAPRVFFEALPGGGLNGVTGLCNAYVVKDTVHVPLECLRYSPFLANTFRINEVFVITPEQDVSH